nr:transforming growth factor-beta-induced protein ig-h3-like [Lytechinus pictus]
MKMLMLFAALCGLAMATPFDQAAYMLQETAPMGLVDELSALGYTKLVGLIEMAGLKETLNTGGPFTIFAPNNDAIAVLTPDMMNNMTLLVNILKAHVIEGKVMTTMIRDNLMAGSLLKGVQIRINMDVGWQRTFIAANGAQIIMFDKEAKNGVIHGMNRVIYPIPMGNLLDAMKMIPGVSATLKLIEFAGIESALTGEGPFTIFAPCNNAWMKIPYENVTALMANKTALTELLTYHVAPGAWYSTVMRPGTVIPTLEGKNVLFNPMTPENLRTVTPLPVYLNVNEAEVVLADQSVANGVIWVLNEVITKPSYLPK